MIDYQSELAAYVAGLKYEDLPPQVITRAKLAILDWLACVYRALGAPPIEALLALIREEGGCPNTPLIGYQEKTSLLNAVLLHGAMSHTPESDDIFKNGSYHPAVSGISAAFSMGLAHHYSGRRLLAAIVASYEAGTRIALSVMPSHSRFWHPSATIGAFGAAAAGANLLGLTPEQTGHALGLAATQAAGLWAPVQGAGAISKPLHAGKAAYNGVFAVLAAEKGLLAGEGALCGEGGFITVMSADPKPEQLISGLGQEYNILQVMVKFYPNCAHMHSALDALIYLRDQHQLRPADIEKIEAVVYETSFRLTAKRPKTVFDAKFSLPLALAALLERGQVNFRLFSEEALQDPALAALMEKITVIGDAELERDFPRKRRCRLSITTKDGQTLCREEEYRKGDPEKPLSQQEFKEKYLTHVAGRLSEEAAEKLWQGVMAIDELDDISLLMI